MSVRKSFLAVLTLGLALASAAHAITPPPRSAQPTVRLAISWINPAGRENGDALAAGELRQTNIYISSSSQSISVMQPASSFTYTIPAGLCIRTTDSIVATVVDKNGLESAASNPWSPAADINCPKSYPGAATNLKGS